ncbi:MFS transporter [Iodobacter sp. CM08]|uniref:MFS transporter n=1 Tax=Iodobacter sp. CM08 TaxID=3085902 RepID=UPI002980B1BA|nr:MFS transporter [Iodobacter sp. CM08]MDW5419116.1 MFS transporter [Iodobacter sp. CM08]
MSSFTRSLLPISSRQALFFCLLLAMFELLIYVGSDIVMPAMLYVVADLNAPVSHVPIALNAYLLGGVAFQWLIGPLSDRFGRRPLLLIGAILFAVACLITPLVGDIYVFNVLRFIQGIALGFVVVVSYPALQESFEETDAVRLMALLANIALLSPLLGPLLGSMLLELVTWRTLFVGVGVSGILVLIGLWFFMPETIGVTRTDGSRLEPAPLNLASILASYRELLGNARFMQGSFALGLISIPLIGWIGLAPLLLMNNLGLSSIAYGLWQLPIFAGLIAGNLALNYLVTRFELDALIRLSLWPIFGGLLFMLAATLLTGHLLAVVLGLTIYAFGMGICNATLYRQTLFASESSKGTVAAMLGMISVATIGLGSSALALLGAGTSLAAFAIAASIGAGLALWPLCCLLKRSPITTTVTT